MNEDSENDRTRRCRTYLAAHSAMPASAAWRICAGNKLAPHRKRSCNGWEETAKLVIGAGNESKVNVGPEGLHLAFLVHAQNQRMVGRDPAQTSLPACVTIE
jgi:hypothetical protein